MFSGRLWYSKKSAILIQRWFRRYKYQKLHQQLNLNIQTKNRFYATIQIQSQMRRYLTEKQTKEKRILYKFSTMLIQRMYRGHNCRLKLYRLWAVKRIQKFMKRLHFLKFRDTVIMIMQLRLIFSRKFKLATRIQSLYRGYRMRLLLSYLYF